MSEQYTELPNIQPNQTDRVIAKAIDDSNKGADDHLIRLSTGVVLKAKQANPSTLIRVMTKLQRPTPPEYFNKAMGKLMENPDDPDYISRVQAWQMEYSSGMLNVLIGKGTDLVSVPDNIEGPHPKINPKITCQSCKVQNPSSLSSCEKCGAPLPPPEELPMHWLADYRALGLPVILDSPAWLYITWVMQVAAPTDKDLDLISQVVKSLSGVKEADVRDAENFPAGN